MRDLHWEIWQHVFTHVRRDSPPAHEAAPWRDLNQHDMSSLMRVSTRFNKLAGPILYTSATTIHFSDLVKGFDKSQASSPKVSSESRFPTKNELLKHVKHLRIAYHGPSGVNAFALSELFWRRMAWEEVGAPAEEVQPRQVMHAMGDTSRILDATAKLPLGSVTMPNLETVVIGKPGPTPWTAVEASGALGQRILGGLKSCQQGFTDCILRCRPKSICQYTARGPYALHSVSSDHKNPSLVVTTHFSEPHCPLLLIGDAINRLIYSPGVAFKREYWSGLEFLGPDVMLEIGAAIRELGTWQKEKPRADKQVVPRAKIEIYGLCHPPHDENTSKLPNDFDDEDMEGYGIDDEYDTDVLAHEAFYARIELRDEEDDYLQRCHTGPAPGRSLTTFWKKNVTFHKWQDSPICGPCQWNINDQKRWEEWYEWEEMAMDHYDEDIGFRRNWWMDDEDRDDVWRDPEGNIYTDQELWEYDRGLREI